MEPSRTGDNIGSIICLRPFYSLELNVKGDVSVCCPAWSRGMIGNLRKKSLREIWSDRPVRHMRRMMLEGRWEKICRPTCPVIMNYRIRGEKIDLDSRRWHVLTGEILSAVRAGQTELSTAPTWINFANSSVCNLTCIMCGREKHKDDAALVQRSMAEVKEFLPGLREIFLAGNGDPFARADTRDLLLNLDHSMYPDLRINLLTNGLLLPKYWDKIRHLRFGSLNISVDAATRQTYEKIRRGGTWQDLLAAFDVVKSGNGNFHHVIINMTVMRDNYREIPAFVELASRYGFGVAIDRIRGKWGNQNFFSDIDGTIMDELRDCILDARSKALDLGVHFNCSSFCDVLEGKTASWQQRCRQKAIDSVRYFYYKLKP